MVYVKESATTSAVTSCFLVLPGAPLLRPLAPSLLPFLIENGNLKS